MNNIIINPIYKLKPENDKTYILSSNDYGVQAIICVIHPIFGMMLSFFNGVTFQTGVKSISEYFNISIEKIEKLIRPLLNNSETIKNTYGIFPKNILINCSESVIKHNYKPEDFKYSDVNLGISRFSSPVDIIFNITMKCCTSCIYCYADRKNPNAKNLLPVERIFEIIDEAKKIGVIKFKLMGGEVFLHKDWYRILKKLAESGFKPDISTKVPLKQEHINAFKEFDIEPIQLSLDSMIKPNLSKILNVKESYYDNFLNSFKLLEDNKVKYTVHTVLTKINAFPEEIDKLKDFFIDKKYLINWMFDIAKCSMYTEYGYDEFRVSTEQYNNIREYIINVEKQKIFNFSIGLPFARMYKEQYETSKLLQLFEDRTPCSGNLFAFYLLPDGKVTLCEELYWHPKFIIGDLSRQSIMEVWNSPKALELFNLKQESIQKGSACRTCTSFSKCRKYRHVCWRDVILGYGMKKWDYPDLYCPNAPKVKKEIYIYPNP